MQLDKKDIESILQHREPMLLIDSCYLDEEQRSHGYYTVRGNEWFLQGHFPGNPIVPGVIQLEMMAQSCCLLLADVIKGKTTLYTGLDKVRFKTPVVPGDRLEFVCEITNSKGPFWFAKGEGLSNGKTCIKAEMSFAVVDADA